MRENIIENLIVNQAKQIMLDSITGIGDIDFLKKEFTKTLREKWKLESNWKELKKWLEDYKNISTIQGCKVFYQEKILNKMQELEGGKL